MRVAIFDDDGVELAQGYVNDMKLDGRTRHVNIGATIMPLWRPLPEGGHSAKSVMDTLMDHLVSSGRAEVTYSRIAERPSEKYASVQSVGLS